MQTAQEKLLSDLHILETMACEMDAYLNQDVLFWRMTFGDLPMLTIGGYLLRQQRLQALAFLLGEEEQRRLQTAVNQFNATLQEKIVRFEQKAYAELEARIRQWRNYLNEAEWKRNPKYNSYATAVEARLMLALLTQKLQEQPYQLPQDVPPRIDQLDALLRGQWQMAEFVWFVEWQPAYPRERYWWLYGRPI